MQKIFGIIIATLILFGCNSEEKQNIVAQVNDDILTLEELKSPFSDKQWNLKTSNEKKELAQEWIDLTVLSQSADNKGITDTPEIQFRLENSAKTIKANALIAQEFANIKVTENDMFEYYKLHQNKYKTTKKEFKVQRIFTENAQTNRQVLEELRNGMTFSDAAKKFSKEDAASNSGYIGFVSEKDVQPEIWKKLNELKKWHYASVNTDKGFYIVRYYQTRNVEIDKKFNDVKNEIRKEVLEEKREKLYKQLVNRMRKQIENIKIFI